jgi:hypothetical protein
MTKYSLKQKTYSTVNDKENQKRFTYLDYVAHNDKGKAIAKLNVTHEPEINATQQTGFYTGKPVADMEMTHTDTPVNESNWNSTPYTRPAMSGEQMAMFGYRHVPAKRTASGFYSAEGLGGRTAGMTLLGIADNASTEATGRNIVPSSNLSQHSGGLVDRLHKSGHISAEDMPENRLSNTHSFEQSDSFLRQEHKNLVEMAGSSYHLDDLSSRVPAARTRIRDLLGNAKKGEEHKQLSLWDD